jgi:hypothetical protein
MERNAKPNFPSAPKLSLSTKFTGGQFRWGYFRPSPYLPVPLSPKDALSVHFERCSTAHIFRGPAGTVLPKNLLDLGLLSDAYGWSLCTIPAVAPQHHSDCLAAIAGKFDGLPLPRKSRTYLHHVA